MKVPVRIIALFGAAVLLLALTPAHAARSKRYVAGFISDTAPVLCGGSTTNPTAENVGGACFSVSVGTTYRVTIQDDVIDPVGYFWAFRDRFGNTTFPRSGPDPVRDLVDACTACGFGCADSFLVRAPSGAAELLVATDGPIIGGIECADRGSAGFGTTGTITVEP